MNIKVNGVNISIENGNISLEDNNGNAKQVQAQSAPKKSHKKLIAGLCILGGLGVAAAAATAGVGYKNGYKTGALKGFNEGYQHAEMDVDDIVNWGKSDSISASKLKDKFHNNRLAISEINKQLNHFKK